MKSFPDTNKTFKDNLWMEPKAGYSWMISEAGLSLLSNSGNSCSPFSASNLYRLLLKSAHHFLSPQSSSCFNLMFLFKFAIPPEPPPKRRQLPQKRSGRNIIPTGHPSVVRRTLKTLNASLEASQGGGVFFVVCVSTRVGFCQPVFFCKSETSCLFVGPPKTN